MGPLMPPALLGPAIFNDHTGLFVSHRAHAGTQRVASGIGDERMSSLPRGGDSGARYASDYVVAIGYDAVDITALNGIPVIGMDKGHHAVRGRVSFQRDAACASSQGVAYTRASAYDEHVVATKSSCPAQSVKSHVPRTSWVHVFDPELSNTPAPTQIHTNQAT